MSTYSFDLASITGTEHDLLPAEMDQGIHRVVEIRYRNLTIVVLEGESGEMFGGMCVNRQDNVAFVRARQNSWNHIRLRRERKAQMSRTNYEGVGP